MQTKSVLIQFQTEHVPGDDPHLNQILESYFKGKGVDYKAGVIKV